MDESVQELTSSIASGDTEAFARLYREWFDHALAEARRCTGRDEQFCLDAVHDAMLRLIKRLRPLDSEAALSSWITATVRSASIDLIRRETRRRRRERAFVSDQAESAGDASPSDAAERIGWLRTQLAQVDPKVARALDLRFRLNWTLTRIAETLRLKPGAVDGRIKREIARLRAAAQKDSHE